MIRIRRIAQHFFAPRWKSIGFNLPVPEALTEQHSTAGSHFGRTILMTAAERLSAQHHHPLGAKRDPVCGMSVDATNAKHRADYAGDIYFFCSARCREEFTAE